MIIKFSFQNEIHRTSEAPLTFASLPTFLTNMFKASLPESYDLFYVNPEGKNIPLNNEQDYETLRNLASLKAIKVLVVPKEHQPKDNSKSLEIHDNADYEVIHQDLESEKKENEAEKKIENKKLNQEESKGDLDRIATELTKIYVLPDLMQINGEIPNHSLIQKAVRDSLELHLPSIIFQAKSSLAQQGLIKLPNIISSSVSQQGEPSQKSQFSGLEEKGTEIFNQVIKAIGEFPGAAVKITDKVATKLANVMESKPKEVSQDQPADSINNPSDNAGKDKKEELIDTVTKTILNLPNSATSMADAFVRKLSGDPYILTEEGRYSKSALEKVNQLKVIFPEGEKKEMLEYVQRLPKELSVEQVASLYADYKNI